MNGGIIIKTNAKQRYASDAVGSFLVKKLLDKKGGKVQEFEVRNDMYVNRPLCATTLDLNFQINKALWVNRWPHVVQTRLAHRRCWLRDALDAFHPGDRRVTRRTACHLLFHLLFRGICGA